MAEGGHSDHDPPAVPEPTYSPPTPNLNPPDPDVRASQTKEPTQARHSHHKQHYELNKPLPKTQGSKSGSVVLEQPGSCQVTELVQHKSSMQLLEGNHSRYSWLFLDIIVYFWIFWLFSAIIGFFFAIIGYFGL